MIMDDFNVVQGESIFSGLFHENHKEVMMNYFQSSHWIRTMGSMALDEFTDYRTYMIMILRSHMRMAAILFTLRFVRKRAEARHRPRSM